MGSLLFGDMGSVGAQSALLSLPPALVASSTACVARYALACRASMWLQQSLRQEEREREAPRKGLPGPAWCTPDCSAS